MEKGNGFMEEGNGFMLIWGGNPEVPSWNCCLPACALKTLGPGCAQGWIFAPYPFHWALFQLKRIYDKAHIYIAEHRNRRPHSSVDGGLCLCATSPWALSKQVTVVIRSAITPAHFTCCWVQRQTESSTIKGTIWRPSDQSGSWPAHWYSLYLLNSRSTRTCKVSNQSHTAFYGSI